MVDEVIEIIVDTFTNEVVEEHTRNEYLLEVSMTKTSLAAFFARFSRENTKNCL